LASFFVLKANLQHFLLVLFDEYLCYSGFQTIFFSRFGALLSAFAFARPLSPLYHYNNPFPALSTIFWNIFFLG